MDINARSAGPPSCSLIASQSPVSAAEGITPHAADGRHTRRRRRTVTTPSRKTACLRFTRGIGRRLSPRSGVEKRPMPLQTRAPELELELIQSHMAQ